MSCLPCMHLATTTSTNCQQQRKSAEAAAGSIAMLQSYACVCMLCVLSSRGFYQRQCSTEVHLVGCSCIMTQLSSELSYGSSLSSSALAAQQFKIRVLRRVCPRGCSDKDWRRTALCWSEKVACDALLCKQQQSRDHRVPQGVCLSRPAGSFLFEVSAESLLPYDSCPRSLLPLNASISVCALTAYPSRFSTRVRAVGCAPRHSNVTVTRAGVTPSGAIFAGGHQINFAQASHHRTAGPLVGLQVGLPFFTCHLGVASSAATTSAAVQHTICSHI